jgi:mannose-6-phosphate isomerase-like protein (cupin superfamily)
MNEHSDAIEIPRTGEKLIFVKRPRNTNGELVEIEFYIREFALAAARPHVHTNTEEVEVIAGAARMRTGQDEHSLGPGDKLVIPPGTVHFLRREGEEFLHFRLRFRPPMKVEALFETLFGLHSDGKNFRNPLQSAIMAREHETYLGGLPIWLQKPLIAAVAWIGRLFGYRPRYEKYSGPESQSAE